MAAGASSPATWRVVFGNTEKWMPPQLESPTATVEDTERLATWRVTFGNTSAWLPPQVEIPPSIPEKAASQRCELCRQPIADGEDFVTNSAGDQPTHAQCAGLPSSPAAEPKLRSYRWLNMLSALVRHQPNG